MTREEYMKALKNNIQSLTVDEQNEALQYYEDYFDEANDDQKVMNELGTPEEVASTIIEKFANALVETDKDAKKDNDDNSGACLPADAALGGRAADTDAGGLPQDGSREQQDPDTGPHPGRDGRLRQEGCTCQLFPEPVGDGYLSI